MTKLGILYILGIYNIDIQQGAEEVNILISNASEQPIYQQIETQIKALIIKGELKDGDALPSMRLLAKELRISLITTKRAYEELERDGFIYTVTGKGSFVASKNLEFIKEQNLKEIENLFEKSVQLAKHCQLDLDNLKEMLEIIYKGE